MTGILVPRPSRATSQEPKPPQNINPLKTDQVTHTTISIGPCHKLTRTGQLSWPKTTGTGPWKSRTRIGRVRIWLWREKAGGARELRDIQVRAIGNERTRYRLELETNQSIFMSGLSWMSHNRPSRSKRIIRSDRTQDDRTRNRNRVDDKLRKKYDRFGLSNLKQSGIGKLSCGRCKNELVDGLDEANTKWFALPPKIGKNSKPSFNEGFIGDWFLEFDLDWIDQIDSSQTMGWIQQSVQWRHEIFKLIESNGFYKVMIKNSRDNAIDWGHYGSSVPQFGSVVESGQLVTFKQKLARSKLIFENGTPYDRSKEVVRESTKAWIVGLEK
ncbi:hypothetical protein KEM48_011458 [Puccinia striiformis f. sp. tritici PST-130]|nr:hypothetical protein KEM48_011458 [Puccinia striiformis f. sp. tritici PST-130]